MGFRDVPQGRLHIEPPVVEPTDPGWYLTSGPNLDPVPQRGKTRCDVRVVGAGWMGLHAAWRHGELSPDQSVVPVDAGRIGNNASGRCMGFAIDLAHNPHKHDFVEDIQGNRDKMTANLKGNAHLRQAVEEPGVACDRDPQGRYHSAATDHGVADLVGVSGALDVTGQKYRRVEAGETAEMTGSRHSLKALHHPGTILIQPAKYLKNMARKPPPNVTVHANTGDRDGRVRPRRSRVRNALGRGPREEGDPPRLGLSDPLRIFRNPAGDLGQRQALMACGG